MPVRTRPTRASVVVFQALLLVALIAPAGNVAAGSVPGLGLHDRDFRTGLAQPTAGQLSTVRAMGAHATWNRFGTPASLIK